MPVNKFEVGDSDERPWGSWRVVEIGQGFAVKTITIRSRARTSDQRHLGRSEHWIIVSGRARVWLEEECWIANCDEVINIPLGAWHRIGNDEEKDLVLVEVMTGSLLDEVDIERRYDDYGRSPNPTAP